MVVLTCFRLTVGAVVPISRHYSAGGQYYESHYGLPAVLFQTQPRSWNFDKERASVIAPTFTNEVGDWKVVADGDAPSKPNVLAQLTRSSGPTFNIALVGDTNCKDVDVSVSMKSLAGNTDQGGGLVWRAKDARNYYIARYNPLEDNYRVYKVQDGRRSELQSANVRKSPGWHSLRITMVGDRIECYYDGRKYLDVKDTTSPGPGKIGLWTKRTLKRISTT